MKNLLLIVTALITLNASACIDHNAPVFECEAFASMQRALWPLEIQQVYPSQEQRDVCQEEIQAWANEHGIYAEQTCLSEIEGPSNIEGREDKDFRLWHYGATKCFYVLLTEIEALEE